ncbi:hypothetical protein V6N11_021707 [Hibiscus sabdariffa]|uniref:Uncharacterized protein n=1 Tax=Hibiscus sabdariffa TaxID=183260 RepID=A0ABR2THA4_9ROSI
MWNTTRPHGLCHSSLHAAGHGARGSLQQVTGEAGAPAGSRARRRRSCSGHGRGAGAPAAGTGEAQALPAASRATGQGVG